MSESLVTPGGTSAKTVGGGAVPLTMVYVCRARARTWLMSAAAPATSLLPSSLDSARRSSTSARRISRRLLVDRLLGKRFASNGRSYLAGVWPVRDHRLSYATMALFVPQAQYGSPAEYIGQ